MLRLTAADADDLAVISTQMQDAVMMRADMRFDKKRRRFALVANRFAWDALPERQRRRAGLYFDDVRQVQVLGLARTNSETVLSLLAITFKDAQAPAGHIILHFAAGAQIRLGVDAINANLADLGGIWSTGQVPAHEA